MSVSECQIRETNVQSGGNPGAGLKTLQCASSLRKKIKSDVTEVIIFIY